MTINWFYFFLTFLVIAISGNPAMAILGKEVIYIGTLMIFMALWWFKPLKLTRQDVLVFVLFSLLMLTHVLSFGSMVVVASLGFLIKLGIALLAVRLIPEFPRQYVSVMYVLSLISFVFFVPSNIGVDMQSIVSALRVPVGGDVYHIGLYNFETELDGTIRNAGMFWEPGAFAGYLILALFFLIRHGQTKAVFSRHGLVLIATLLTTQSTTGYLAFMVLIVFYVYNADLIKGKKSKMLVLPAFIVVLVGGAYVAMNEVSFLGEKISGQMETATEGTSASRINRFGNFMYDIEWIADKPVLGWSATPETRFSKDPEVADLVIGQGNGLTGFAVKFGLVGLFIFIGFFAYSTRQVTGSLSASLFGLVIVCALLNGEQFLGFPMFLSLMFVPQNKSKSLPVSPIAGARKLSFAGSRTGHRT